MFGWPHVTKSWQMRVAFLTAIRNFGRIFGSAQIDLANGGIWQDGKLTVRYRRSVALLRAGALLAALEFAPTAAVAGGQVNAYTLTIQSTEQLQLAPKEEKAWYETGPWPLIGAGLTLVVTNGIAIGLVYLQSSRSFNALLRQRKIDLLSASLNEFYNPLLALLDINREIFDKTGPSSFPEDEEGRSAADLVWKETKKKILTNNAQIETILRTKTHLLEESDSLDTYHRLLIHVAMYETFQKVETDLYQRFFFPQEIRAHVFTKRAAVLEAYYEAIGEQI